MAGHSHWAQIKHKKGANDEKRGLLFSKLLAAISIAARDNPKPDQNPRLRTTIEKARAAGVPNENIDRALKRSTEAKELEEVLVEAYGPEGAAILIQGITTSKNRTIAEVKHLLTEHDAKFAEPGSVLWAFKNEGGEWKPAFPQAISNEGNAKLAELVSALEGHGDVQRVTTNMQPEAHS
jgi:YebC/PmpR family DNA-binding regulatory protein